MNIQCLKCKGRNHCSRPVCPLQVKIASQKKLNAEMKQDFSGKSPNIFVGKFGYPNVNVGMLGIEQYNNNDNPLLWSKDNYDISQVIGLRSALVNSNFKSNVKSFNDNLISMSQEVSMAAKPVDVEINLNKKPNFNLSFNQDTMPHGPSVKLKKAAITENPKIPTKVDKVVSDIDFKAAGALNLLFKKNFDEHYLTKLLSVGNLGVKTQRKLVPTRWAITAVDDTVGKDLIKQVKDNKHSDYLAYFGGHLGNYYLILMFPDAWSYELFETYIGKSSSNGMFGTDYENYNGRKQYAYNTAGGYYAARIAVLEKLNSIKRQSSVLCLRFITDEYWAPLGVWVCRESVRKSVNNKPVEFSSKELMLKYAVNLIKRKFGYDLNLILKESQMLKNIKMQKKLIEFC